MEGFPDLSGFVRFCPDFADFNFLSEEKDKFFIFIFVKNLYFFLLFWGFSAKFRFKKIVPIFENSQGQCPRSPIFYLLTQTKPNYGMHAGYKTEDVVLVPDGFQERLVACAGRRRSLVAPDLYSGVPRFKSMNVVPYYLDINPYQECRRSFYIERNNSPAEHSDFYSSKLGNHVLLNTTYFSFRLMKELKI